MKKTSRPIVFFGNERIATGVTTSAPTLRGLIEAGYDIKAVVANYEAGKSRRDRPLEVAEVAKQHNIPVLLPTKPIDIIEQLRAFGADIGVLVAYGKIIPQNIIDVFPHGIINIHPSLLPQHRGPTPLESVLRASDTVTGVSIMQLVKAMDAGPVYAQSTVEITEEESKQTLANKLLTIGSEMVITVLPKILDNTLLPQPQNDQEATYDQLISKNDGTVDWNKPASVIAGEVRAYMNWPGSRTTLLDRDVTLLAVEVSPDNGQPGSLEKTLKSLKVYCGHGSIIVKRVKPDGKKEMDIASFLAGIKR